MSYNTGIDQRVREQTFFNNTTAEDQSLTQTNLSLIANLRYVQTYLSNIVQNYLPVLNPNFQGTLTSSTGGNINLTGSSALYVPTITSNTNFTANPTINGNQISVIKIGEIKMFLNNSAPNNFILCNGASYPITQYPTLFNLIKYTYGGSGNFFNIPNFQSHFPIGANSQNGIGCALSNFATGNGSVGAYNTYAPSTFFGGDNYQPLPPVIDRVPSHTHNIQDNGHQHDTFLNDTYQFGTPFVPPEPEILVYGSSIPQFPTLSAQTGIIIEGSGTNIQVNDPVSNLNGVNVSPPYIAVNFYICYE
jgi:hypothetical protein